LEYRYTSFDRHVNDEILNYDKMNRLFECFPNDYKFGIEYDPDNGLIRSKTDVGSHMDYKGVQSHALNFFDSYLNDLFDQEFYYTDFKKIKRIRTSNAELLISYGVDEQRIKSTWNHSNQFLTRYYMGNYEEEIIGNTIRKIHYICGGNGLAAIYVQHAGQDTLYYAHTDYQGSLIALSLPNGTVVERYAYDPWGSRRNPEDWTQTDTRTSFILNRGYTMHEHLDVLGLINMNGRMYDPLTSMFLSPDPYLQAPGNWLNYNRYSYGLNNPLLYTDPTGELAWFIPLIFFAVQSGMMQGAMTEMNGGNFWGGIAKGAAISAASSLLTFGVGEVLGHAAGSFGTELLRAGAHGLIGGGTNLAQGGNFWQGFAISCISSLAGSGMQAAGWNGDYLPFATGVAGAGTAWAVGGDPMSGFFQGFGVGALNHKGERLLGDDGVTMLEMSCDDIAVMPRSYMASGTWYDWSPILGCYMEHRVTKEGLENVYPEFDVLMLGRGMYNAARGLFTSSAANTGTNIAVHGNSLQSTRPTWGYKLYSNDGTFLKNGITSKAIPETRYNTKGFMVDKYMVTPGSTH
jgi:RHS repeat-associated protein